MQAELNIGLFGHVDHGKTTLTHAISGKWTDTHSEELKRGISIRLGYAQTEIYECGECGYSFGECKCGNGKLKRKISLVDAPGHETLMTTAIAASSIIDGALFLIAANEKCPMPQSKEHLLLLTSIGVKNIVVVQTKIDLVGRERAVENKKEIEAFLERYGVEAPIIPVSAHHKLNLDALAEALEEKIPTPERDEKAPPKMLVSRSFDINKPGTKIEFVKGGVLGGSISRGTIKKGMKMKIIPGISRGNRYEEKTITVESIMQEGEQLEEAKPGGLMAIGTTLDPALAKSDSLSGNVLVEDGYKNITVSENITVRYREFRRNEQGMSIREGIPVVVSADTQTSVGAIRKAKKGIAEIKLKKPIAVEKGTKIALSLLNNKRWRLAAIGEIEI